MLLQSNSHCPTLSLSRLEKGFGAALSVVLLTVLACWSADVSPVAIATAPAALVPGTNAAPIPVPLDEQNDPGAILLAPKPITLPVDDASHDAVTEWWYYNGHLKGDGGRRYGFVLVIFKRQGEQGRSGYIAHVAITDHQREAFQFSEDVALPPPAPEIEAGFDLRVGEVWAKGGDGQDKIAGSTQDYLLELELTSQRPAVLHGKSGYIGVSSVEASYYYSRTLMLVQGSVVDNGQLVPVTGRAWMDHQWGEFTLEGDGGWEWYSLQLEDNTQIMASVVRDGEGAVVLKYGTFVDRSGHARHLTSKEFNVETTDSWTSPVTNVLYPMGWTFDIPDQSITLRLSPVLRDQELDTSASVDRIYWEGEVLVTGTVRGQVIEGLGYVELTGYDQDRGL